MMLLRLQNKAKNLVRVVVRVVEAWFMAIEEGLGVVEEGFVVVQEAFGAIRWGVVGVGMAFKVVAMAFRVVGTVFEVVVEGLWFLKRVLSDLAVQFRVQGMGI